MELQPTHHCFDDAMEYLDARARSDASLDMLVLVHGIIIGPSGEPFAHAWIEEGPRVIDAGLLDGERVYYACAREEFYASRTITLTKSYTWRQAATENRRSGHFGPWDPELAALCGQSHAIHGAVTIRAAVARSTKGEPNA
jgi:hypothetical protein